MSQQQHQMLQLYLMLSTAEHREFLIERFKFSNRLRSECATSSFDTVLNLVAMQRVDESIQALVKERGCQAVTTSNEIQK